MVNKREEDNLFTLGILSAIKYEDVRIELCKEIIDNPSEFDDTDLILNGLSENSKNSLNNAKRNGTFSDEQNKNNTKYKIDLNKEKEDELNRKNNFKLKYERKITKECQKQNKTHRNKTGNKNETEKNPIPEIPDGPVINNPNKTEKELPKDNTNFKKYSDDPDIFVAKTKAIINTLGRLKSNLK